MNVATHGIVLEIKTRRTVVEVYVNGIPAGLCGQGVRDAFARPVHELLIDQVNELALLVNPGDTPATCEVPGVHAKPAWGAQPLPDPREDDFIKATQGDGPLVIPEARAALVLYANGAVSGDGSGTVLLEVVWNAEDRQGTPTTPDFMFPRWVKAERNLGPMFGPSRWQQAPELTLDDDLQFDVQCFVEVVQLCLQQGRADDILEISRDKYREVAAAYGIDAASRADIFRRVLTEESAKDSWLFRTPSEDEYSLRLCAGKRLIECIGTDWTPLIKGVPDPESGGFVFPMLIGRAGPSDWLILR